MLETLMLYSNNFIGQLPLELGALPRLKVLSVSKNLLTGSIPEELLREGSTIEELKLWGNLLQGSIPTL